MKPIFSGLNPIAQSSSRPLLIALSATVATFAMVSIASIDANAGTQARIDSGTVETSMSAANQDPANIKSVIEAQPNCENFVRFDANNSYFGFGDYRDSLHEPRAKIPSHVTVAPLDGTAAYDLATLDSAVDITTLDTMAYVLTYSGLEQWDLVSKTRVAVFATYDIDREMKYKEHAMALARYGNWLIIAHGRIGVSFFDLTSHKLVQDYRLVANQSPLESMATGVTIQGRYAYVAVDNFNFDPKTNTAAFRGLIIIDMDTQKVAAQLPGIDPGVTSITSDSKNLVVDFGGIPLWKYDISRLGNQKLSEPTQRLWQFPQGVSPIGHATMDATYYYTCVTIPPSSRGGHYTHRPMALDRHALRLD